MGVWVEKKNFDIAIIRDAELDERSFSAGLASAQQA